VYSNFTVEIVRTCVLREFEEIQYKSEGKAGIEVTVNSKEEKY
jgi:hypothetical protein